MMSVEILLIQKIKQFQGDNTMVFSSLEFLFRFLPLMMLAYFVTPERYRNVTLLIGSLAFYAYGEPIYILLMVASIVINHVLARKIYHYYKAEERSGWNLAYKRRRALLLALIFDLGALFIFKYLDFFIRIINGITPLSIPEVSLTLPLGISFYTFQIISYVIDVYR